MISNECWTKSGAKETGARHRERYRLLSREESGRRKYRSASGDGGWVMQGRLPEAIPSVSTTALLTSFDLIRAGSGCALLFYNSNKRKWLRTSQETDCEVENNCAEHKPE
jgi:hypothetical protein